MVGIVQVLADTPIRRRKTIGYNAGRKSSGNKELADMTEIIIVSMLLGYTVGKALESLWKVVTLTIQLETK